VTLHRATFSESMVRQSFDEENFWRGTITTEGSWRKKSKRYCHIPPRDEGEAFIIVDR